MQKTTKTIIVALIFTVLLWFLFFGNSVKPVEPEKTQVISQIAMDSEGAYKVAKSSGKTLDACIQAGIVAAAYLQAQDEVNFKKWKAIQEQEAQHIRIAAE